MNETITLNMENEIRKTRSAGIRRLTKYVIHLVNKIIKNKRKK